MIRRSFACAMLVAFAAFATAQPAPKDAKDSAFKVAIDADLSMDVAGQQVKIVADTVFQYTWKREAKSKTLLMDLMTVKVETGGMEIMNVRMSRAGFFDKKSGNEVKIEDAPAQLKELLTDSFGNPICKIELDAAGNDGKRTVVAAPGAKTLIDAGMIANATLFHPPYMAEKDEWKADMEVSAGKGLATGKVGLPHYEVLAV